MWIWSEYISNNSDCDPALFNNYAHIWGQRRGSKLDVRRLILSFSLRGLNKNFEI